MEQEGLALNDWISRQALIDYLMTYMAWYDEEGREVDGAEKLSEITDLINGVPSAESELDYAKDRYMDLCDYFSGCSDHGDAVLHDRKEFKAWLDRMYWHVAECSKLARQLEETDLPPVKPTGSKTEQVEDYISRRAAVKEIKSYMVDPERAVSEHPDDVFRYNSGLLSALQAVEDLPSAEPERKRGKWLAVDSLSAFGGDEATWMAYGNPVAFHYCSECRGQAYAGEDGESLLTGFCPNCGAEMDV